MIEVLGLRVKRGDFVLEVSELIVPSGAIFALVGPNGSGKTTLLEVIAGFIRPERGVVRLKGINVTYAPPEARGVGYVPQDLLLFAHATAWENITMGLRRTEEFAMAREVCSLLGIDGLLKRRVRELSGGEKQKVALARALVRAKNALLLDEPLSSVDHASREKIAKELRELVKSWTRERAVPTIYVSHDINEVVKIADIIVRIDGGRILGTCAPQESLC